MIESKASLPDKLSELILVALEDLAKVRADPRYQINLETWHQSANRNDDGLCSVCFAGAVIAGRMAPDEINRSIRPDDFADNDDFKLEALNDLRSGLLADALRWLTDEDFSVAGAPDIDEVNDDDLNDPDTYANFQYQMRATSKWLAERGL